ncbi:hypothetical protein ACFWJS_11025 [Streptomyces sp. NPDC127061]|uniref:hypothetical protein n=1 Tax=Streptomyces sp. NPDC127061 TaxID=3347122 RepID=UPI00365DC092
MQYAALPSTDDAHTGAGADVGVDAEASSRGQGHRRVYEAAVLVLNGAGGCRRPSRPSIRRIGPRRILTPFPPSFRGLDIEGQEVVLLGTDGYGCAYGVAVGVLDDPLDQQRRAGPVEGPVRFAAAIETLRNK